MIPRISSTDVSSPCFSFSIICNTALMTSPRLCGGILVAIPTAIPDVPLTRRLGILDGRTTGSFSVSSKLGAKSTVSLLISASISMDILLSLASVYRIAAAESPSTEPKFPCPSTNGYLVDHSCARLTKAPYIELSPCGWYLPMVSPTIRAHFLCGLSGPLLSSIIEYRILL